jgi:hypothetical protein
MSNKNAATEDEVGKLHSLISRCNNMKAGIMLATAQELLDSGADPNEILQVINNRDLSSMQKWVEYNAVSCRVAADDEQSELSKRLKELKMKQSGKIVSFTDIREAI